MTHSAIQIARIVRANSYPAASFLERATPIRPKSVRDRAASGSSGGCESSVLCRAGIGKLGQPGWSRAHGPDVSGNPAKLGAPIKRVEGPHIRSAA